MDEGRLRPHSINHGRQSQDKDFEESTASNGGSSE
jgi:hypothetical protein